MARLEQHYVKYLERDGEDEIIVLTSKEHKEIHREMRANGMPLVSEEIIQAAHARSPRRKSTNKKYQQSEEGKVIIREANLRHEKTVKGKAVKKKYSQTEKGVAVNRAKSARYHTKQKAAKMEAVK